MTSQDIKGSMPAVKAWVRMWATASGGTGNHIRQFLFAVAGGSRILCDFRYIAVEHQHGLFKKFVPSGTAEQIGQEGVVHRVVTDGHKK